MRGDDLKNHTAIKDVENKILKIDAQSNGQLSL